MEEIVINKKCNNCGNSISQSVSIHSSSSVECNYCGVEFLTEEISNLKQERMSEITVKVEAAPASNFNPVTFGLLMFFFWPVGVFYFIKNRKV